ncbi:MAG TPA: polysaccharide deacetylase [Desulfotomaculum sp.]|nr:MAG: Polysaccharide deacetylase [Desulfotomaculum sp. 46_80]KUK85015.1 MAG: Polysaccharide deacetylase [Desulfofundulus kuznetsovii]HAG10410.1 polysaccharide deacetylase [Desulfotomaculum sp.]HBY03999.1 polysaccharide deacetylase [Desulfotomaculum sp.]
MYHKVSPDPKSGGLGMRVTPARFNLQMQYLAKNGYHTVKLIELADFIKADKTLPPKSIVITFDDGYLDNYKYAFPVLKKYGFTATVFVVADYIGKTNDFDAAKELQPVNQLLGWNEINQMSDYGITIGAHTLNHVSLTDITLPEARYEIENCKLVLEKQLGTSIEAFAYPYGHYNNQLEEIVKESGYTIAVTTKQGWATPESDPYAIKRIRIRGDYNLRKFINELRNIRT